MVDGQGQATQSLELFGPHSPLFVTEVGLEAEMHASTPINPLSRWFNMNTEMDQSEGTLDLPVMLQNGQVAATLLGEFGGHSAPIIPTVDADERFTCFAAVSAELPRIPVDGPNANSRLVFDPVGRYRYSDFLLPSAYLIDDNRTVKTLAIATPGYASIPQALATLKEIIRAAQLGIQTSHAFQFYCYLANQSEVTGLDLRKTTGLQFISNTMAPAGILPLHEKPELKALDIARCLTLNVTVLNHVGEDSLCLEQDLLSSVVPESGRVEYPYIDRFNINNSVIGYHDNDGSGLLLRIPMTDFLLQELARHPDYQTAAYLMAIAVQFIPII